MPESFAYWHYSICRNRLQDSSDLNHLQDAEQYLRSAAADTKEQQFLAFARPLFEKGVWVPLPPFLVEKRLEMRCLSRLK